MDLNEKDLGLLLKCFFPLTCMIKVYRSFLHIFTMNLHNNIDQTLLLKDQYQLMDLFFLVRSNHIIQYMNE